MKVSDEWPFVYEYEDLSSDEQREWDDEAFVDETLGEYELRWHEVAKHKCLSCHRFHYNFCGTFADAVPRECPYCGGQQLEEWESPHDVYISINMGTGKIDAGEG